MKEYLKLNQLSPYGYEIMLTNGKFMGSFETLEDGYFYYFGPNNPMQGAIPHHLLVELALKLEELNEPWDRIVTQNFSKFPDGVNLQRNSPEDYPFTSHET